MNTKRKYLSAFNYFGGKSRLLDWLFENFPAVESYNHYVEPFCGSAVVFLNKKASPIETINDIDGRIMNFFRVLREQPEKLISLLELTPYNRNEFDYAYEQSEDVVEDARRFFVRVMMCYGGGGNGVDSRRVNSFRMQMKESRRGVSLEVSKYFSKVARLEETVERLKMAQHQNIDALKLIEACNDAGTFIYCDSPYIHESRTGKNDYNHELSDGDHRVLAALLHKHEGLVAVSGYKSKLMDELYGDWTAIPGPKKCTNLGKSYDPGKREYLYTNYQPARLVQGLFHQEAVIA